MNNIHDAADNVGVIKLRETRMILRLFYTPGFKTKAEGTLWCGCQSGGSRDCVRAPRAGGSSSHPAQLLLRRG